MRCGTSFRGRTASERFVVSLPVEQVISRPSLPPVIDLVGSKIKPPHQQKCGGGLWSLRAIDDSGFIAT